MDSKAECDQLNLAHLARKQTNASSHLGLVQYRFRIREGRPEGIRKTPIVMRLVWRLIILSAL